MRVFLYLIKIGCDLTESLQLNAVKVKAALTGCPTIQVQSKNTTKQGF
jgi:hypothetical protein